MELTGNHLYSVGYNDNTVMVWALESLQDIPDSMSTQTTPLLLLECNFAKAMADNQPKSKSSGHKFVQAAFLDVASGTDPIYRSTADFDKLPPLSLKLNYVYGCQFNLKKSAMYGHIHTPGIGKVNCQRYFCYFVSRFAVALNPQSMIQTNYTLHKSDITAMDVHASEQLVATAAGHEVHVWRIQTMGLAYKVATAHEATFLLRFSNSSSGSGVLAVLGITENQYELELVNWKQERLLMRVELGVQPVTDLLFNPFNSSHLSVCGVRYLSIWKRQGRFVKCIEDFRIDAEFSCLVYVPLSDPNPLQEADLVLGTSLGDLMLCLNSKLTIAAQNAHQGPVNCLQYARYKERDFLISGGEDGFLHIWNRGFKQVNSVHMTSINDPLLTNLKQGGISNMCVYACETHKPLEDTLPKEAKMNFLAILVATRSGALMELNVSKVTSAEKLNVTYKVFFEGHCQESASKVLMAQHQEVHALATVSDDSTLKIWDYDNHTLLASRWLDPEAKPTAIKFSRVGVLAVGLDNGALLAIVSKGNSSWGIGVKAGSLEVDIVFTSRESNSAVLAIEFSWNEEYMAVSYDNFRGDTRADAGPKGGSDTTHGFIMLYQQVEGSSGLTYRKHSKIVYPFANIRDLASYPSRSECAATLIEFSRDSLFLGILHQKVKYKDHLPNNSDHRPLILIYDLTAGNMLDNFEALTKVSWERLPMAALLYSTVHINPDQMFHVSSSVLSRKTSVVIGGASDGTLHAIRLSSFVKECKM